MMVDWGSTEAVKALSRERLYIEINKLSQRGRLQALEAVTEDLCKVAIAIDEEFIGRREVAEVILASLVSGVPVVLLGPPGLAKSAVVRRIVELCGGDFEKGDYFEYLLTNHTMPEHLFGPPDLASLKDGEFRIQTKMMLPQASVAFLDEVFRGGSHILNTLLAVVNERKFHNGQEVEDVPLIGVVGASNQPPVDPELEAFVDRFPVRVWLDTVLGHDDDSDAAFLSKTADLDWKKKRPRSLSSTRKDRDLSLNHLRASQIYLSWLMRGGGDGQDAFRRAFLKVRHSCMLSDRSFGALFRIGRALDLVQKKQDGLGPVRILKYAALYSDQRGEVLNCVNAELGTIGYADTY